MAVSCRRERDCRMPPFMGLLIFLPVPTTTSCCFASCLLFFVLLLIFPLSFSLFLSYLSRLSAGPGERERKARKESEAERARSQAQVGDHHYRL